MFPPFPENSACLEAEKLIAELDSGLLVRLGILPEGNSGKELSPGQMFGVAICENAARERVVLRAFSGQLAGEGRWLVDGFVPPCIDVEKWNAEVERADPPIKALTAKINQLRDSEEKTRLIAERKNLSHESLKNIYGMYEFCCWDGHTETYQTLVDSLRFGDVFSIPTGTGDCCAPKLINYCNRNGMKILSMAEFFYGKEPASGKKKHKEFYPPCDEKCSLVLPKMLGLEILYRDEDIIVVNKPSGLLSIPGRGDEKFDSVSSRVRALVPGCIEQPTAHRLDMDTSGLMVLGLTAEAQRNLSMQFEARTVSKKYYALLRGRLSEIVAQKSGTITLKQRLDIEHRPYQIFDEEFGKVAVTDWRVLDEFAVNTPRGTLASNQNASRGTLASDQNASCARIASDHDYWRTLVEFEPQTGRTHQLRLASSHPKGLGISIVGDNLYGTQNEGERLCLQSFYLEFDHPVTKNRMKFVLPCDFL